MILFCDLHGHSRKKDIFMFGCEGASGVGERVFPRLCGDRCDNFNFDSCAFRVQKNRSSCARITVFKVRERERERGRDREIERER